MKLLKIFTACLALLLSSCQDSSMEHFQARVPHLLRDTDGRCYFVEHDMGNIYRVHPIACMALKDREAGQ